MQDDAIDLALVRPETRADWMRTDVPFNASFVVVAARGHPSVGHLPEGAGIPLDLFFGLDHVLRSSDGRTDGAVDLAPARFGRKRRVVLTLPQFHSFVLTAAKGLLVAALPVQYARAFAAAMGLVCHCLPNKAPAPDIFMY